MLLIKKIHEISSEIELEALEKGSKVKESTVQKPYFNGGIEAPPTLTSIIFARSCIKNR
jgi:hypothetical protein